MRATLEKRGLWRTVALAVLLLLPVTYLLALVSKYGVNVPYADEFTLAPCWLRPISMPLRGETVGAAPRS